MSRCRHRLYQALQQHSTARPDHIWISDDLVSEGFSRFVRHHKRYGSSVPGPLEAQKRLSKRRHAALASMGFPPSETEAAILFGKPSQPNQEPQLIASQPWSLQAQDTFPYLHNDPPLVSPPFAESAPPDTLKPASLPDNPVSTSHMDYNSIKMHLSSSVRKSASLSEFKKRIFALGIDPRGQPLVSRTVLSEILLAQNRSGRSRRWDMDDLYGFFSDGSLNIPSAENYVTLVEHCVLHTERKSRLYAHFRFLKRSIMLGVVPVEEISKIIKLIPSIKTKTQGHRKSTIGKDNWGDVAMCYQAVWDGLDSSSVLAPRDLDRETMALWVDELLKASPPGSLSQLCMDVIHAWDGSPTSGFNLITDVLLRRVVHTAAAVPESAKIDMANDELHGILSYTKSLLEACSPEAAIAHIIRITELLIFSPFYNKWSDQSLGIWYWVLCRLDNDLVLFSATSRRNLESASTLALPLLDKNGLNVPNRHRHLLHLWVVAVLGHTTNSYSILDFRRKNVFRRLLSYLDRTSGPFRGTDILTRLRIYLQCSCLRILPATDLVLSNVADIEFAKAQKQLRWNKQNGHSGGPQSLDPAIKTKLLDATHSPKSIEEILPYFPMYTRNRTTLYSTFDQLAKTTDITSPSFIRQIVSYIESGTIPRSAILRLLRRHTPLKVALSRCWQEPAMTPYPPTEPGSPPPDPCLYPNPTECLRMLHILALVFSCTTTVTPTSSWRLTRWVYLFIVQHHGPVAPILARALYQAGVTRYREVGQPVSKPKFAFIMKKIAEAEGAAVAKALMDAEIA
ncbi:hypothetical protein PABG_01680 [Paracoccidioides brasiliensis Pb03]|nr:hypothetical protein PABG_01680 [Paracoccidioides brasiliensis Pb03]